MNLKTIIGDNSPTLLASLGVAGFITAVVLAAKTTPKAVEVLEEYQDEPIYEKAKAIAPIYAPVAAMCMLSTACIAGSNHIQRNRYATLLTVYSLGQASLSRWQQSIIDTVGEKKYEEIEENYAAPQGPIPGNLRSLAQQEGSVLFFDVYSGRYFAFRSVEDIRSIINDINEKLYEDDFVPINDYYHRLGLDPIQIGDEVGWIVANGNVNVVYNSRIHEDLPCITLSFDIVPKEY